MRENKWGLKILYNDKLHDLFRDLLKLEGG